MLTRASRLLVACLFAVVGWWLDWHSASLVVMAKGGGKTPSAAVTPTATGPSAGAQRPISTANTAARAGGGISPEFLAGVVSRDVGSPGAGLNVLGDIQANLSGKPTGQQPTGPPAGIDPYVWQILQELGGGTGGAGDASGGPSGGGGQGVGGVGVSADTG